MDDFFFGHLLFDRYQQVSRDFGGEGHNPIYVTYDDVTRMDDHSADRDWDLQCAGAVLERSEMS